MPRQRDDERDSDLHSRIFELLLEKVRQDPYPSTTHLAMLEGMIQGEDEVDAYTGALMDKAGADSFPSLDHLRRLTKYA